jgi:hypothetical protein
MTLKDAFQDISGIGPKKAQALAEIARDHEDDTGVSERELRRVRDALERGSTRVALGRLEDALSGE